MNAPVVILAVDAADAPAGAAAAPALTPAALGLELFEAAMREEVALSDHAGCWALLRHAHGHPSYDLVHGARRIAIDLVQRAARRPNDGLMHACRSAVAMIEDVTGGTLEAQPHAVLAQVADLLDGALALTSDGGH